MNYPNLIPNRLPEVITEVNNSKNNFSAQAENLYL